MNGRKTMKKTLVLLSLLLPSLLSGCLGGRIPLADFTATPRFDYPPLDVRFDGSASHSPNGAIVSYKWDFDDGTTGSGAVVEHTFTEKGVYSVTLTVTDSAGKSGSRTKTVEALNRLPVASFSFSPYYIGVNQPATFDGSASYDPDGEIVQYIWSFGDGTSGEGMIVEHSYTSAHGSGWKATVTLTVVDDDGGSSSINKQINVVGCDSCGS